MSASIRPTRRAALVALAALTTLALAAAGCAAATEVEEDAGAAGEGPCAATVGAEFPDVVDAVVEAEGGGDYTVSATLCSAYDTPERYADAWRVLDRDGTVLGVRELLHDHASEQPFTRSLGGVEIPDGVGSVTIEGRDLANGWGGGTIEVAVP